MYADPLDLFRNAVAAPNNAEWRAVAALCDPASLRRFKRTLIDMVTVIPEQTGKITSAELMRAVPNMPRAVAEYQTQFRESVNGKRRLNAELPSVKSREDLESMIPADAFAAWLDGKSFRRQVEREVARGRLTRGAAAQVLEEAPPPFDFRGLAFVEDGDRIGYIIYRRARSFAVLPRPVDDSGDTSPDDSAFAGDLRGRTPPMSSTVRRQSDGGWLLVADTDFLSVSQMQSMAGLDDIG